MKVLVVGAGFLGSEVLEVAQSHYPGLEVIAARRNPKRGNLEQGSLEKQNSFKWISLDVLSPESFVNIPDDIDIVVYAVSAVDGSERAYHDAYVRGLSNIVSYFSDSLRSNVLRKFVFISSTGVYSEDSGLTVDEESPLGVDDSFSFRSRLLVAGEDIVRQEIESKKSLVLRFSGIYGQGRNYLIDAARALKKTISPEEDSWTNRIHKVDGARAILYLAHEVDASGTYIISDSKPVPRSEVLNYLRTLLELSPFVRSENNSEKPSKGKICKNTKLINSGFSFNYPTYQEGYESYAFSS